VKNRKGTALRACKFRGGLVAKLRAFWHTIIRNRDCELCYDCGRPYELWWCPDAALWSAVTGYGTNGLCCPRCFHHAADARGVVLEWRPAVFVARALGDGE
jgi:hypothetical protein